VFLANKDAVLTMLQRFTEDLTALQRAIRTGDGDRLFEQFSRTRAIRRSIIAEGQDDARADFGRSDHQKG
jgi:cyclohexadieny/prephenate dehydrogenase